MIPFLKSKPPMTIPGSLRAGSAALLLSLLLLGGTSADAEESITLTDDTGAVFAGLKSQYFIDADKTMSFAEAAGAAGRYQPWGKEVLNLGYSSVAVWTRFAFRDTSTDRTWFLKTDAFDDIRVYLPRAEGGYRELKLSRDRESPDAIRRAGAFFIKLPRLDGSNYVYLRYVHDDTMVIHLTIAEAKALLTADTENIFNGIFFGIMGAMILYNLLLFFLLRDSSYLYYSCYILSMMFLRVVLSGIIYDILPAGSPFTPDMVETIFTALALASYNQFIRKYLIASRIDVTLDKLLGLLALIGLVILPTVFFLSYFVRLLALAITFLATFILTGILVIRCLRRRYTPVLFYIAAGVVIITGVAAFLLRNIGLLPEVFFAEYGLQFGSAAEALLLAFGLAFRINLLQKEKANAEEWGRSNLEKAERMESDYRMLFDTAPLGIALFTLDGRYLAVNHSYCRMYERPREELLGKCFFNLVYPETRDGAERAYWDALVSGPRAGIATFERTNVTRTGRRITVRYFLNFTEPPAGAPGGVLCCVEDITDLRAALDDLRSSVREKELLLKEVHHRVKNNLQIIISLFRLKSREIDDPRFQAVLEATAGRIRAIANVHNRIYLSKDVAQVESETFIPASVKQALSVSHLTEEQCVVVHEIEPAKLSVDIALPLSLIINELITNSITHGYNGREALTIQVRFRTHTPGDESSGFVFEIEDSGRGFPENFPRSQFESFGLNLVETLATQLGGTMTLATSPHSRVTIAFGRREQ